MTYSTSQLIDALTADYEQLCHDCAEDDDMTVTEYRAYLFSLSYDQLVAETATDDAFTLEEFMDVWS
jgi:hypothetical protein